MLSGKLGITGINGCNSVLAVAGGADLFIFGFTGCEILGLHTRADNCQGDKAKRA